MIVQACLNGARPEGFHPELPFTPDDIAQQAAASVRAGAAELHLHPRAADGRESLSAVDKAVLAVRRACPGTLVGVSTGAWIEESTGETCRGIEAWRERPDYASVNLSEPDAPTVMDVLHQAGVGVEAGLASVSDAERLLTHPGHHRVFRVLIEVDEQDLQAAHRIIEGVAAVLDRGNMRRPLLLHGFDATVWRPVDLAFEKRWSTRVGLEDGKHLPDGSITPGNAALVAAAVHAFRKAQCR